MKAPLWLRYGETCSMGGLVSLARVLWGCELGCNWHRGAYVICVICVPTFGFSASWKAESPSSLSAYSF